MAVAQKRVGPTSDLDAAICVVISTNSRLIRNREAALEYARTIASLSGIDAALEAVRNARSLHSLSIRCAWGRKKAGVVPLLDTLPKHTMMRKPSDLRDMLLYNITDPQEYLDLLLSEDTLAIIGFMDKMFGHIGGISREEMAQLIMLEAEHIKRGEIDGVMYHYWDGLGEEEPLILGSVRKTDPIVQLERNARKICAEETKGTSYSPLLEERFKLQINEARHMAHLLLARALHQYLEEDKFVAKTRIITALQRHEGDTARQKKVIDVAIEAWGVSDLTMGLNRIVLQDVHGEEESLPVLKELRPAKRTPSARRSMHEFSSEERLFLLRYLDFSMDEIAQLEEGDKYIRSQVLERLTILADIAPDSRVAEERLEVLRERFAGKSHLSALASKYGVAKSEVERRITDILFAAEDLARVWVDFKNAGPDAKFPKIPKPDLSMAEAIVQGKYDDGSYSASPARLPISAQHPAPSATKTQSVDVAEGKEGTEPVALPITQPTSQTELQTIHGQPTAEVPQPKVEKRADGTTPLVFMPATPVAASDLEEVKSGVTGPVDSPTIQSIIREQTREPAVGTIRADPIASVICPPAAKVLRRSRIRRNTAPTTRGKRARLPEPKVDLPRDLSLSPRTKANRERIREALRRAKEQGAFRTLKMELPDSVHELRALELRYLGGDGISDYSEVAQRLKKEEGRVRAPSDSQVMALEKGGLALLSGFLEQ